MYGAGVPLSSPFFGSKVTPFGSAPVMLTARAGKPVTTTVNEPLTPTVNVVLFKLMTVGNSSTVSLKSCTALVPTPLPAVKTML